MSDSFGSNKKDKGVQFLNHHLCETKKIGKRASQVVGNDGEKFILFNIRGMQFDVFKPEFFSCLPVGRDVIVNDGNTISFERNRGCRNVKPGDLAVAPDNSHHHVFYLNPLFKRPDAGVFRRWHRGAIRFVTSCNTPVTLTGLPISSLISSAIEFIVLFSDELRGKMSNVSCAMSGITFRMVLCRMSPDFSPVSSSKA